MKVSVSVTTGCFQCMALIQLIVIHTRHLDHSRFFQLEASQYLPLFLPASSAPLSGFSFASVSSNYYSALSLQLPQLSEQWQNFCKNFARVELLREMCKYVIIWSCQEKLLFVTNIRTNTEKDWWRVVQSRKGEWCKLKILLTSVTVNETIKECPTDTLKQNMTKFIRLLK